MLDLQITFTDQAYVTIRVIEDAVPDPPDGVITRGIYMHQHNKSKWLVIFPVRGRDRITWIVWCAADLVRNVGQPEVRALILQNLWDRDGELPLDGFRQAAARVWQGLHELGYTTATLPRSWTPRGDYEYREMRGAWEAWQRQHEPELTLPNLDKRISMDTHRRDEGLRAFMDRIHKAASRTRGAGL